MTPLGEFAQGRFYIFAIVPGILRKFLEESPLERLGTELSSERVRRCTEKGGNTLDRNVLFVVAEKNLSFGMDVSKFKLEED